jgi:hypothetical protein
LDRDVFKQYQLLLIHNIADWQNDGWLRLSGHEGAEVVTFVELLTTRVYRWFRLRSFQVVLNAYLPSEVFASLIGQIRDGVGLAEHKQWPDLPVAGYFAAATGSTVASHAPGSRVTVQ